MTNEELLTFLQAAMNEKNILNRLLMMKRFEKKYHKSSFFKATHISLKELVFTYRLEQLLSGSALLENIQEAINNLDADKITAMFDKINESTLSTIRAGANEIDRSNLSELFLKGKKK